MAELLGPENTTFTLDHMGRFLCNTLDEAIDSSTETIAGKRRDFDVIVVGGGTFGSVIAQSLFAADVTHSRRILVLEGGPFVLPEHVQNLPFGPASPTMRVPWEAHSGLSFAGLLFAFGGRSLTWGGWSPELLHDAKNDEMLGWPSGVINDLKREYFNKAGEQIGVNATNDFIYGELHRALRRQLIEGLKNLQSQSVFAGIPLAELPESPMVRAIRERTGSDPSDSLLREMLDLPPQDTTPRAELLNFLKVEAPLGVQSHAVPGQFPVNKFSAIPLLVNACRQASNGAAGIGPIADARKRLMVVGSCHVQELITETQDDDWVRVTGVRAVDRLGNSREVRLAPPSDGRQSVVIIATGTIESTRLALTTFQQSLRWRAAQRMGKNLMAHLRSNFDFRIPRESLKYLPSDVAKALQVSALFVKGKARIAGEDRYFHLQITASGLPKGGTGSEAELFKKVPDIDKQEALLNADDKHVVITLRGIGEMVPHNPDSRVTLTLQEPLDFDRPRVQVSIGNAHTRAGSQQTKNDHDLWNSMDDFTDQIALLFADNKAFEILPKGGPPTPVPAKATAADVKQLLPHSKRRDALGTTHHEAGTLWMGDDVAQSVTNDFGRIHDTTNCYVAGPALFPTIGSPNPMLTGVAVARRTAKLLTNDVLPHPKTSSEPGFQSLFDGTVASFRKWKSVGYGAFDLIDGAILVRTGGDLGLLYYPDPFSDFTLRLEFRLSSVTDNSGVFVRSRNPLLPVPRRDGSGSDIYSNPAYVPVDTGFEVQIDELARGNATKAEPSGMDKKRTGALYDIPTTPGWIMQHFTGRDRQARLDGWNEFEITVKKSGAGDDYTVALNGDQTTSYTNIDIFRGRSKDVDSDSGFLGLQSHTGPIAFRNIRIKT